MRQASSPYYRTQQFPRRKTPHHVIIARGEKIRSFTIRPWLAAGIGAGLLLVLAVYIAATGYLLFRDDIIASSTNGQADLRRTYENRIADLRAELDRVTSRQVVDQDQIAAKLRDVIDRQQEIAQRQEILTGLADAANEAGIDFTATGAPTPLANPRRPLANLSAKGEPALIEPAEDADGAEDHTDSIEEETPAAAQQTLGAVEDSLARLKAQQVAAVQSVATTVSGKSERLAAALRAIGAPVEDDDDAVGGPYEPVSLDDDIDNFRDGVESLSGDLGRLTRLAGIARTIPLARPIPAAAITSRFGRRRDPFLGRPAMHTGIDFRAPRGETVRATAPGKVTIAGRSGGYGNMVEIDHGNGLRTRYGHMSRILVKVGQVIADGEVIGRVGSTGRSTGPHLHYEVRRAGRAIDPMAYIRAGAEIHPLL